MSDDGLIHWYSVHDEQSSRLHVSPCARRTLADRRAFPWKGSTLNPEQVTCPLCSDWLAGLTVERLNGTR